MKQTKNYKEFRRILREAGEKLDVTGLCNLTADMKEVLEKHPNNYEAIEQEYTKLCALLGTLKTAKECPRCNGSLYLSDLPEYDYACPECDENYFEVEVKQ